MGKQKAEVELQAVSDRALQTGRNFYLTLRCVSSHIEFVRGATANINFAQEKLNKCSPQNGSSKVSALKKNKAKAELRDAIRQKVKFIKELKRLIVEADHTLDASMAAFIQLEAAVTSKNGIAD